MAYPGRWSWCGLACLLLSLAGCASVPPWMKPPVDDITPEREQRERELVERFETQRDAAAYTAATNRWQQGDAQGCLGILEELLERNPRHRAGRLLLADLHLFEDRPQEAVAVLETMHSDETPDLQVAQALAVALEVADRPEQAAVHHKQVEALKASAPCKAPPRNLPAGGTPIQGLSALPTSVSTDVSSRRRESTPGQAAPAEIAVSNHLRPALAPIDPRAIGELERSKTALRSNQPSAALDHVRQAMAIDPHNPQIPITAAVELLRFGHASLAVDILEPSLQSFPTSARLHQTLGLAYYRLGNYPSACRSLEQALSLDNSNALSYFLLGSSLSKLGQPEAARQNLQRAATLDPQLLTER